MLKNKEQQLILIRINVQNNDIGIRFLFSTEQKYNSTEVRENGSERFIVTDTDVGEVLGREKI